MQKQFHQRISFPIDDSDFFSQVRSKNGFQWTFFYQFGFPTSQKKLVTVCHNERSMNSDESWFDRLPEISSSEISSSEISLSVPWSRKNAFLARILQDPCKNAITCKILQGNLFLARSCKEMFSLKDLARKCFP